MTLFNRGDVVLVLYPNADLKTVKKRPALVIQANGLETGIPQRIVAMITSNLSRTGPTRITFMKASPEGRNMGLLTDSVIVTDNLATVLEREVDRVIGTCPRMDLVDDALRLTLAL